MRKKILSLIILSSIFCLYSKGQGIQVKKEILPVDGNVVLKASSQIKHRRVNNKKRGTILANIPNNAPLFFEESLKAATELWENVLDSSDSIRFNIEYKDTTGTIYVITEYQTQNDGVCRPASLDRKYLGKSLSDKYDFSILINSTVDWVSGFTQEDSSSKNLALSLARAIGKGLGFGSNIIHGRRPNLLVHNGSAASIFDKLIINSSLDSLSTQVPGSGLYNHYINNYNNFYACSIDEEHKLFADSTFNERTSLRFLRNGNSIMSMSTTDSVELMLGNVEYQIMERIGWRKTSPSLKLIISDEIDSTGICSAYSSHVFRLSRTCTNPRWKYILPKTDGTEDVILTSNGQTFTIPAISNEAEYKRNIEGDIVGTITFEGEVDGITYKDEYKIFLELSPQILNISILQQEDLPNDYTNYKIGINYRGCYSVECFVREEYSYNTRQFYNTTPFYTEFNLNEVDTYGRAWLEIYAWNTYGYDYKEIELTENSILRRNRSTNTQRQETPYVIHVYNMQNQHVTTLKKEDEIESLPKQMFILKYTDSFGREIRTYKINRK